MQRNSRICCFAKAMLSAAALAMTGAAMAQGSGPAVLPVPPKPAEVDKLGDADAVCLIAAAELASRTEQAAASIPADQRQGVIDTGLRQIAYYAGRLSLRFEEAERNALAKEAASSFTNRSLNPDGRPISMWCFRTYLAAGNTIKDKFEEAYRLFPPTPADPALTAIDQTKLDPDALCLVLVGVALPTTIDAGRTDPNAARGAATLGQAQHYFYGRVLAAPAQASVSPKLAQAWRYVGQLAQANDEAGAHAKATACTNQFSAVQRSMFTAAASGVPE